MRAIRQSWDVFFGTRAGERLYAAGVLAELCQFLDNGTLLAACHVGLFRRSITIRVVGLVLSQLFGDNWRDYYAAYLLKVHQPWGAGYNLEYPQMVADSNGYAVINALKTLAELEKNCANYNKSFVPGEPSRYGIERISLVENGRLLWVHYHAWHKRYCGRWWAHDGANRGGTYVDSNGSTALTLDGHFSVRASPKEDTLTVPDYANEVWDIGSGEPVCLWSSFFDTPGRSSLSLSNGGGASLLFGDSRLSPVSHFTSSLFTGFWLPQRRPMCAYSDSNFYRQPPARAVRLCDDRPTRFVTGGERVVDLVQMEQVAFNGDVCLKHAVLSEDHKYLSALVGHTLVVWRVALPRPEVALSVPEQCSDISWWVGGEWLVTFCAHVARVRRLCDDCGDIVIDIGFVKGGNFNFRLCHNEVLYCDGVDSACAYFIQLPTGKLLWAPTNFSWSQARLEGLETTRFVQSCGRYLVHSTTGHLVTFGGVSIMSDVLAYCECTDGRATALVKRNNRLAFWQVLPEQQHLCSVALAPQDVKYVTFSPSGRTACIETRDTAWVGRPGDENTQPFVFETPVPLKDHNTRFSRVPRFVSENDIIMQEFGVSSHELYENYEYKSCYTELVRFGHRRRQWLGKSVRATEFCPVDMRTVNGYHRWVDILRNGEPVEGLEWVGANAMLSPGGRFMAYAAHRIPQINASPHVELVDLAHPTQHKNDIRSSRDTRKYCKRLRPDYDRERVILDTRVRVTDGGLVSV